MKLSQLVKARQLIKKQPWLIWSTRNFDGLDAAAVTEAILSYGNWRDFLKLKRIFGLKELQDIFVKLTNKKRVNLRPQTVNLFNLYFQRYAS
ncbi:MAG: hypothetical protein ABIJ85_01255 [bacterium]